MDKIIWVADPVDGTYNFVHGNPEFAVMNLGRICGSMGVKPAEDVLAARPFPNRATRYKMSG